MKKAKLIMPIVRIVLTTLILFIAGYALTLLEYTKSWHAVDNLIGAAPALLIVGIAIMLIALVWKRHRKAITSTFVLGVLSILWLLLLIPAINGNWFALAKLPYTENATDKPDLSVFTPFKADSQLAILPAQASLEITDNQPKLDGATALYPVYAAFANAVYDEDTYSSDTVVCTNTPNAYQALIDGKVDVIFVAGPSEKQKQASKEADVELHLTPIGKEAFVFLVGKSNPIESITRQQIRDIYSGKTAYWKTLGWSDGGRIIAFQRPEGSGSQTALQKQMKGLPIHHPYPLPDDSLIGSGSLLRQVSVEWNGVQPAIGYSYRYYATTMYPNDKTKLLAIDNIYPNETTIADDSYPIASSFYAVTNGTPSGNVKRLIDWILTDEGQQLIKDTGYIPLK